eukprot:732566-Prymnesium_polylepis.1
MVCAAGASGRGCAAVGARARLADGSEAVDLHFAQLVGTHLENGVPETPTRARPLGCWGADTDATPIGVPPVTVGIAHPS